MMRMSRRRNRISNLLLRKLLRRGSNPSLRMQLDLCLRDFLEKLLSLQKISLLKRLNVMFTISSVITLYTVSSACFRYVPECPNLILDVVLSSSRTQGQWSLTSDDQPFQ